MKGSTTQRLAPAEQPDRVPTIEHAGMLEELTELPPYIAGGHKRGEPQSGKVSCSYCGVGDSGDFQRQGARANQEALEPGEGSVTVQFGARKTTLPATVSPTGEVDIATTKALTQPGGTITGELTVGDRTISFIGQLIGDERAPGGQLRMQRFVRYTPKVEVTKFAITGCEPTSGCVKLRISTMHQRSAYPIHLAPSILDRETGTRQPISYREAISRLAELLLTHREADSRTLVYASGQLDYFTIFAMQEVFRLLGIRNLTGNAEHCLNAGAVHNEVLTGQEGPFLTIEQALTGPNRVYLLNGWNGMISHPPVYRELTKRRDLDGYLVEVMVTETAKGLAQKLGSDHILLIRPRADAHLALAVAHEIFEKHPEAIEQRFVERFSDKASFDAYKELAMSARYAPERVAERIAPEPHYKDRILNGIRMLAIKLSSPDSVPIIIPSVGLSQSSGIVAHCLWGNLMGALGKYGLKPDGTPAGGVLRVPGQINAESEIQGLSRKYFFGRIRMEDAADAAARMDLPEDAYQRVIEDQPRAALDYSEPTPGDRELFLCFGTQFEANMPNRQRWLKKLQEPANTLVVIDPIPDPWSEANADLIIPSPPHPATTKMYQNGEWKVSISVPQKRAASETRSDPTIIYDAMAEIAHRLEVDMELAAKHTDLRKHVDSGYMHQRFCPPRHPEDTGLTRLDGEVSRVQLFERIQVYLHGGKAPLYCALDHADGTPITWDELLAKGSVTYGGVGVNRYVLDYEKPDARPFRDIFGNPGQFKFFFPTEEDLEIPDGIIFNSGRSALSDDRQRVHFATSTFNSGKATPVVKIPDEHPLYISPLLAERTGLETGDMARVRSAHHEYFIDLPVVVTDRVKGESVYVSFHRSKAQEVRGLYINDVTDHVGRCAYSGQVQLKIPRVTVERASAKAEKSRLDTTVLDTAKKVPVWSGTGTPLYVTEIIQETSDVYTFRFQGDPICRFAYKPGQFASLTLDIDGQKVVRSYSISSAPTRPYTLELTIKRVEGGLVSNWLPDNISVGDRIQVKGPKGRFCLEPGHIPKKLLLVGAGSGITPLMSMLRWLCDIAADVDVKLYNCVRSSKDIIYKSELEMMYERYSLFSGYMVSATQENRKNWKGERGRVSAEQLRALAPDLHERRIYMCGPNTFMDSVKEILRGLDFEMSNLHVESFGGTPAAREPLSEGMVSVQFAKADKTIQTNGALPLLDLAEENDIEVAYGCRSGSCGDCKLKLLEGEVDVDTTEGLTPEEVAAGYVLSCVAVPKSNCIIDA